MSDVNKAVRHDPLAVSPKGGMIPAAAVHPPAVRSNTKARPAVQPEQGLTPRFLLTALRRWWLVATPVGLLLAAVGAAAVYFLLFEPIYEAAALCRIEERTPFLAFENRDEGRSKAFFQTQVEMLRLPLVIGPVIKRPEIAQVPEIAEQPDKVAWLAKRIKVTPVGESEFFRIAYASPDPSAAANVVNAVTDSYFKLRDQSDAERNQRVIDLLGQEMEKRSKEVLRQRDNVRTLAKEVTGKDPFAGKTEADGPQRHPLSDLEGRLIQTQVEGTLLEARIKAATGELEATKPGQDALEQKKGTLQAASGRGPETRAEQGTHAEQTPEPERRELTSPQEVAYVDAMVDQIIEGSQEVQQQKSLLTAKQARLKETEQKSAKGKEDPACVQLAKEIAADQQALDQLRTEMKPRVRREAELAIVAKRTEMETTQVAKRRDEVAKMRSDLMACRVLEQMLKDRYEEQRKNVQQSSGDTLELVFRRDELARAEKVFELIAQRALQLQTERAAPARITLVQRAEAPVAAVELFPYRNMVMAVLAGFCLPFALVVFWERLAGRINDVQSFEQQSTVEVLGEITHLPTRTHLRRSPANARIGYEIRLFEESIDSLRTSLSLSNDLAGMRILAVTSAANHEGKTSVAAQLAVSFARATGEPLLLIDGDMRSPDIHNVFQVPLEPGLAKVLAGECSLEEAVVATSSNNVHVLPAGRLKASPHKLLGNGTWKGVIAKIPACYRYVVIDTPPVLAASEALVLTNAADATLVCMMRDVSRLDQVRKTIGRLAAAGSRPVGTVLNGVTARHYASRYGDYSYAEK